MLPLLAQMVDLGGGSHGLSGLYGALGAAGGLLWISMVVYCLLKDEERSTWIWVLLFFNVLGGLVYFFARFLPRFGVLDWVGARGRRLREIQRVEGELVHLGDKPHLLHRLGVLLLEAGRLDEAEARLRASLSKQEDRDVRYDLARALAERGERSQLEECAALLTTVLAEDRSHAYGDALRLEARVLFGLGREAEARPLYEELVRTRPSAEARYHYAVILERAGDAAGARQQCDLCQREANATPAFAQGRARQWVRKARALGGKLA